MKNIFLDIDGVLNTRNFGSQDSFDSKAVANLARIIESTGAAIVISSSWKFLGLSEIQRIWRIKKLPGKVIDITPDTISDDMLLKADLSDIDNLYTRGNEIKEWLKKHIFDNSNYVIIDDSNNFLPEQYSHLVQTDPKIGLSASDARRAIEILNKN